MPAHGKWAFDQAKFVLLNLAVGGGWPGYPDATTTFPPRMEVDYVRVYQKLPSTVKAAAVAPTQAGIGN
jgi:beta-glucanase (GH16 family)